MRKKIISIVFNIGVNVIGLPEFHEVKFTVWQKENHFKNKFQ